MKYTTTLILVAGAIDVGASVKAFENELNAYKQTREMESDDIAVAVNAVFDRYKGVNINMPALCSFTLQELGAQPGNFESMNERIKGYIRENADRPLVTKDDVALQQAEPEGTRLFHIARGKAGGVWRNADRKPAS